MIIFQLHDARHQFLTFCDQIWGKNNFLFGPLSGGIFFDHNLWSIFHKCAQLLSSKKLKVEIEQIQSSSQYIQCYRKF